MVELKILVANLHSGFIESNQNMYLNIPIQFDGDDYQVSKVSLKGITIVGADGSVIKSVARTNSSEIKAIPVRFALQQNFPKSF